MPGSTRITSGKNAHFKTWNVAASSPASPVLLIISEKASSSTMMSNASSNLRTARVVVAFGWHCNTRFTFFGDARNVSTSSANALDADDLECLGVRAYLMGWCVLMRPFRL